MIVIIIVLVNITSPNPFVSYLGGSASLFCIATPESGGDQLVAIWWFVNGMNFSDLNLTNVSATFDGVQGNLEFKNLMSEYSVLCMGVFESGHTRNSSQVLIKIQGK